MDRRREMLCVSDVVRTKEGEQRWLCRVGCWPRQMCIRVLCYGGVKVVLVGR
mgnify:CR=1 FL=1